jgi:probable rRNA maturation factor
LPVRLQIERGIGETALRAPVRRRAEAMLALLQLENAELSLLLSSDAQIHQLNKIYRGKDRPTDVLAFAMREGDFGRLHDALPARLLGDVVVSVPTARRQAAAARRPPLDEITMLVAHGLLHLLGWDHDTAAKDAKMRAETDRLVAAAEAKDGRPAARRPARSVAKNRAQTRAQTAKKTRPRA